MNIPSLQDIEHLAAEATAANQRLCEAAEQLLDGRDQAMEDRFAAFLVRRRLTLRDVLDDESCKKFYVTEPLQRSLWSLRTIADGVLDHCRNVLRVEYGVQIHTTCERCGRPFLVERFSKPKHVGDRYFSCPHCEGKPGKSAACPVCGEKFLSQRGSKFCGDACRKSKKKAK